MILLKRKKAVQTVPASVQNESSKEPCRSAVPIIVWMDGDELIMDEGGSKRNGYFIVLRDFIPFDQCQH
ncbi:MAG: hypothetical protein QF682_01465 [Candidatus Thermoplasmatota archaeon]|nr:hypothetical protein [Candidatus Thermoplasmatota archaeon]